MGASELALKVLAFVLTYAIHSTLLLGVASLVAPRIRRSLALKERVWKAALIGGLCTALVQVAASHRTPFFHWTLLPEDQIARANPTELGPQTTLEDEQPNGAVLVAGALIATAQDAVRGTLQHVRDAYFDRTYETASSVAQPAPPAKRIADAPRARAPRSTFENRRPELVLAPVFAAENESVAPSLWRQWTERGLAAWAGFAALVAALFAGMWWRLTRRLRARYELVDGEMRAILDRLLPLAFPRGRRVRLFVAPELSTPVSLGVVRLAICVPPRALDELSADEQESMLAHELAHLMRRDPLWLSIAWFVERLFFFQPLNRIARAELHDVAEMMCDDWSARRTGNRLALASCLARIAGWIVGPQRALPATSMAEAHGRCRLAQRIERLLDDDERKSDDRVRRWVAPAAAGALASWVLVAPGVSAVIEAPRIERANELDAAEMTVNSTSSAAPSAPEVSDPLERDLSQTKIMSEASSASLATLTARGTTAAEESLSESLELLDESIELLRAEFALLRVELDELDFGETLAPTLAALESRAARLERRRDQLRALSQVLEMPLKKPAHPSSPLPTTEVP